MYMHLVYIAGIAFSKGDLVLTIFRGPLEALAGIVYGILGGMLCWSVTFLSQHEYKLEIIMFCKSLVLSLGILNGMLWWSVQVKVVALDIPPARDMLACHRRFTIFHASLSTREPTQPWCKTSPSGEWVQWYLQISHRKLVAHPVVSTFCWCLFYTLVH